MCYFLANANILNDSGEISRQHNFIEQQPRHKELNLFRHVFNRREDDDPTPVNAIKCMKITIVGSHPFIYIKPFQQPYTSVIRD